MVNGDRYGNNVLRVYEFYLVFEIISDDFLICRKCFAVLCLCCISTKYGEKGVGGEAHVRERCCEGIDTVGGCSRGIIFRRPLGASGRP